MKRGLGFAGGAMTAGGAVPRGPYEEAESEYKERKDVRRREGSVTPMEESERFGDYRDDRSDQQAGDDGWSDLQRSLRDEVESSVDGPDLYEDQEAWLAKWRARAEEMGLSDEEAMAVLDSIADLDGGYGSAPSE